MTETQRLWTVCPKLADAYEEMISTSYYAWLRQQVLDSRRVLAARTKAKP